MDVEELKKLQKKIIKENRRLNIIATIIFLIIVITFTSILIINKVDKNLIIFDTILITIVTAIICLVIITLFKSISDKKDIEIFNQEFKKIFILNSLKKSFENIEYNAENGFSEGFINTTNILDTGDIFHSNDYISGTYKNIAFSQADIHIEEKHESVENDGDTHEYWTTTFKGRLMIFDFNKSFKTNIYVISNHFNAEILISKKQYIDIKLEDEEFNRIFNVAAENEHEAFYILTPHFMEKIKEIKKRLNCDIMLYFSENKLYIAIDNNDDAFEWDVLKPINEQIIEEKTSKDIKLITDLIDELNLGNDLFKKEI